MRKLIAAAAVLAVLVCAFVPAVRFTEDQNTVLLARAIYALGKAESYETKLALGTVVMNRVENDWFMDDLGSVLQDQQQFPAGKRYDDESLRAAHAVLSGQRMLPESALYYQAADTAAPWGTENRVASSGNYHFYSQPGTL